MNTTRFIRYPGGKQKLLWALNPYLHVVMPICGRYIEPFVGGGAVFFSLKPREAILSDLNSDLIVLYRGIRNNPLKVWNIYSEFPAGKSSYYQIRDENTRGKSLSYKSARLLYLNRTCFKGMWRHNMEGKFNVGYGGEIRRWGITKDNIIEVSRLLRNARIEACDFQKTLMDVKNGDFIYLDPPYKPGCCAMENIHYSNGNFQINDHVRLASIIKYITTKKSINWIMTNSSHADIRKLYKGFYITRMPGGTGDMPGIPASKSGEIIISNFRVKGYERIS